MKIRDLVFLIIGGLLVISGMVLNSVFVSHADAQENGGTNTYFKNVFCENLAIQDKNGRFRGIFGLNSGGDAILQIFGDNTENTVAYLGENAEGDNEIMFQLNSKNDVRQVSLMIGTDGGRFDSINKLGERVATIGVDKKGDGLVDLRDHHGYRK